MFRVAAERVSRVPKNKTTDAVKLLLRLPKGMHRRLAQDAKRNNTSLNTEILNQLSGYGAAKARAEEAAVDHFAVKLVLHILSRVRDRPAPTTEAERELRGVLDAMRIILEEVASPDGLLRRLTSERLRDEAERRQSEARKDEKAPEDE
jgi:Arc-like DNA binding domain